MPDPATRLLSVREGAYSAHVARARIVGVKLPPDYVVALRGLAQARYGGNVSATIRALIRDAVDEQLEGGAGPRWHMRNWNNVRQSVPKSSRFTDARGRTKSGKSLPDAAT